MATKAKTTTIAYDDTTSQIILPKDMSYADAINWLTIRMQEAEKVISLHAEISNVDPLDALVNFYRALADKYGWVDMVPTPGMFGPNPPVMVTIPVGYGKTMEVPFGSFSVPGMEGNIVTQFANGEDSAPRLVLAGKTRQKYLKDFDDILERVHEKVKNESIYKAKAIKLSYQWKRNGNGFDPMVAAPKFLGLHVNESDLILSRDVQTAVELGLFTPIERAALCRKWGIPLKRGVLLEGPYGTGKTLTALVTALKATNNGWTFIHLDSVLDLKEGLAFAANYAPAVVFVEDIDKAMGVSRDLLENHVLNELDGIASKDNEVITVFTTNHVEQLSKAFLRPGRLDTVVKLTPPNAEAAERLVLTYGGPLLSHELDLQSAGQLLAGRIPAVIREVIERAKLSAVARNEQSPEGTVTLADIARTVNMLDYHNSLLVEDKKEDWETFEIVVPVRTNGRETKIGTLPPVADADEDDD